MENALKTPRQRLYEMTKNAQSKGIKYTDDDYSLYHSIMESARKCAIAGNDMMFVGVALNKDNEVDIPGAKEYINRVEKITNLLTADDITTYARIDPVNHTWQLVVYWGEMIDYVEDDNARNTKNGILGAI